MSSLTVAFNNAQLGLALVQNKMAVVAGNVNNADTAGYTRKVFQSQYVTTTGGTLPIGGTTVQALSDPMLAKQANTQFTAYTGANTAANYLQNYSASYGGTGDAAQTLSTSMDDLATALQALESNPQTAASRTQVITTAQSISSQLNTLSSGIQQQRLAASNDIGTSVTQINQDLQAIAKLNTQIGEAAGSGESTADMEDQRNNALQDLSSQTGIQYFTSSNNQVSVYTNGGSQLVGGVGAATVAYTPAGSVTNTTVYPGGFSGITVNGTDITSTLTTGQIGALVTLRDSTLPGEQDKLDTLANGLQNTVNAALSQGTAIPAQNSVTSGLDNLTNASTFSATGNYRVAVVDSTGAVQSYNDINLSGITTVGGLITALNAISGVSASLNATGNLVVTASNSANGIALNPMNSSISGQNASQYFGFTNLFLNPNNTGASGIHVNPSLVANNAGLAIGALDGSATLTTGNRVISTGDTSVITSVLNALNATQTFAASGNFGTQNSTLSNYIGAIISDAAVQANAAQNSASTASATYTYLNTNLTNETGVNVDEETANMTALQTTYQANAQIISTVRSMFQALLTAVQ